MKCPNCKNQVIQKNGDKLFLRVKGKIELSNNMCKAKCYWCGADVDFYLPLGAVSNLGGERFVIRD